MPTPYAQSVLTKEISASELSRKFVKECFAGWADARPGCQAVVPAPQEAGQPAAPAPPRAVGAALHVGHLHQDEVPPVHTQQEVAGPGKEDSAPFSPRFALVHTSTVQ